MRPGRLDRLLGRQRRQQPDEAPRQHRLAGAGRAEQQHVVAAGGRDLDGVPTEVLAADVGHVRQSQVERLLGEAPVGGSGHGASPRNASTSSRK